MANYVLVHGAWHGGWSQDVMVDMPLELTAELRKLA